MHFVCANSRRNWQNFHNFRESLSSFTVKFDGKSRIRVLGPVAYERFELPGYHVRNPLYPRVTTHAVICIFQSDYREIPWPVLFTSPPHLSRLFLHLFRPSKRCVILSHLTLRLCFYDGEQHPGVRFFVFHENMWVYRWLGHYASSYVLEWLWENRKIFYCFEWEWNLKIAKCFMIREI